MAEMAIKPRWDQIADVMRTMEPDNVLTYEQLLSMFPGVGIEFLRFDVHRAIREVEKHDQRTFECVTDVGYRMVHANEHVRLSRARHKRARKQIVRAISITSAVNKSQMTQDERLAAERADFNSRALLEAMESVSRRKKRVTVVVTKIKESK